eukprot:scaffold155632_cov45-Attheya_sp.AAC.4
MSIQWIKQGWKSLHIRPRCLVQIVLRMTCGGNDAHGQGARETGTDGPAKGSPSCHKWPMQEWRSFGVAHDSLLFVWENKMTGREMRPFFEPRTA